MTENKDCKHKKIKIIEDDYVVEGNKAYHVIIVKCKKCKLKGSTTIKYISWQKEKNYVCHEHGGI